MQMQQGCLHTEHGMHAVKHTRLLCVSCTCDTMVECLHQHVMCMCQNAWTILSARRDLDPGLLMQVGDVELAAGRVRHQLVVLLQNLVKAL